MSNTATQTQNNQPVPTQAKPSRPNETGTVSLQAHMRIFDPKTQKTHVEGRA